jgi:hypothetical protein
LVARARWRILRSRRATLADAIAACEAAQGPDRKLDGLIALAVFPALADLPMLDEGVWRHEDGSRVRALLYSATRAAAATLVPQGCWIEDISENGAATVAGAEGEWTGRHPADAIALCLAALRARAAIGRPTG